MAYTSAINHPKNDRYIVLRASYVRLCNGNATAAALISFFEGWHNYKLNQLREWEKSKAATAPNLWDAIQKPPTLWQHHSLKELELGILGVGKRHSIDQAKAQLVAMGLITIGRNPDHKFAFDATHHYIFEAETLNNLLAFAENSRQGRDAEIDCSGYAENDGSGSAENGGAIPTTSINHNESIPADAGGGQSKPDKKRSHKKKKSPAAEPDKDWQRWVDAWHEFFKARHDQIEPVWNGAQLGALKNLRVYLCKIATQVDGKTRDDCGFGAWVYILDNWDKMDDWQKQQFDLAVVYQKINNILTYLKNGSQTNRGTNGAGVKSGTSSERVDALKNY